VKPGVTLDQVRVAVEDHTLESLLNIVPVDKGDLLFVDAGTVHAVWPGLVILETQQTSDLTYRLYDYGSPRELHLEKSFAAMHMVTRAGKVTPKSVNGHSVLIDEKYFRIERWPIRLSTAASLVAPVRVVQLLFVVEGRVRISGVTLEGKPFEPFSVERNQLAVIPAQTARWSLAAEGPAEIIRILPAGD
jgi:mannose-6-phosphate isomerase